MGRIADAIKVLFSRSNATSVTVIAKENIVNKDKITVKEGEPAKVAEPVQADEPVKVTEPVHADDSAKTVESAKVVESVQEDESVQADETVNVTEPVQVDDSAKIAEPVKEDEPIKETESVQADDSAKTAESVKSTESVKADTLKSANISTEEVWPKSVILARAKQSEKKVLEWIATYGNKFDQFEFAFNFYAGCNRVHVVYDNAEIPEELWFIGDLHGDILALDSALSYIDAHSVEPTIVFLGDLFDRFDYGLEVVMRVLALTIERPGKILWIAGNHDATLSFEDDKFTAGFFPAEFIDYLNTHSEYKDFGRWLTELVKILPVALFLPDGLFVAHGGFPGSVSKGFDPVTMKPIMEFAVDQVNTIDDLEASDLLKTFYTYRVKDVSCKNGADELGRLQLSRFTEKISSLTGYSVKRMLRGHDHCFDYRHEFGSIVPYLTICTLSTWYLGVINNPGDDELPISLRKFPITTPAIAKFRYDAFPEVITLNIPQSVVEQFHAVEELKKG